MTSSCVHPKMKHKNNCTSPIQVCLPELTEGTYGLGEARQKDINAKRHHRQRFRRLCIGFGQSPTFFVTPLLRQNCPNCGFGDYSGLLFLQPSFSTPRTSCFRVPVLRQSLLIICFCSPHDLQKKLVSTPIASNKNAQI